MVPMSETPLHRLVAGAMSVLTAQEGHREGALYQKKGFRYLLVLIIHHGISMHNPTQFEPDPPKNQTASLTRLVGKTK